jgi:hypothetical protein
VTVRVAHHPPSPPIAPFDAQTALIMNLFDPPDTSNGYISRQGVREDHSDPTRTINLAKWVVTAPYTDENEEISPPNKKIRTLTVNYERNFRTTTSILRQTLLRPFKIIFPKYFCLNYPREKAIFQTGPLTRKPSLIAPFADPDLYPNPDLFRILKVRSRRVI